MSTRSPILIIGRGSIGLRHADVLSGLGFSTRFVSRRRGGDAFSSIAAAFSAERFAAAVVATETSRHTTDLRELQGARFEGPIIVEKPLCSGVEQLAGLRSSAAIFVGYNLRFHPVVEALRDALARDGSDIVSARIHAGQALDTWRPGRVTEAVYSAHRNLGGGILRDLSHELDLLLWLFGPVERVTALGGRYGDQTVDADDNWSLLAVCRRCPQVTVTLNGMDRPAKRVIAVTTKLRSYIADLVEGSLACGDVVEDFGRDRNESYRRLWQAVLGCEEIGTTPCRFEEGVDVVGLIAAIEQANEQRAWVQPARA